MEVSSRCRAVYETIYSTLSFPPLQVVGLEGFFGIISLTIILMCALSSHRVPHLV
jgi:hypothetical protein